MAGVCGGVAEWMGIDPSLVRIVWVLLTLMSGGLFLLVYVVMAVVVPEAPPGWVPRGRYQAPGGTGTAPWGAWGTSPGTPPAGPTGGPPAGSWSTGAPGGAWTGMPADAPPQPVPGATQPRHGADQAGLIAGVVLIILGAWFLVRDYVPINWDLVWPVVVIALGAVLITGAARRSR